MPNAVQVDCDPMAAYEKLYDRFSAMAGEFALGLSEADLRLAAWVAVDELLARLGTTDATQPAILRSDLPDPSEDNIERAMAIASVQLVRLTPPADAPDAVVFAYRVAEAMLGAIWAGTTVH